MEPSIDHTAIAFSRSALPSRTDSLGRRSRFKRQPTGKRIVLTGRDIEIFRLLWRYRCLRSDRIVAHLNPKSPKRLIERLGDLYHETHHLDRPTAQWRQAKAEYKPQAYQLTKLGLQAYAEAEPSLQLPYPAVRSGGAFDRQVLQFEHALQISETLFDIERMVSGSDHLRFLTEQTILDQASLKLGRPIEQTALKVTIPKTRFAPLQRTALPTWIVPDALFGIEHQEPDQTTYRFYALEVERQNPLRRRSLEKPSALKKLLAYQALQRSGTLKQQLSLPALFLIIAASTPQQLLAIKEMAEAIWTEEERWFLLFVPPVDAASDDRPNGLPSRTASLEPGSVPPLCAAPFVEITQKWLQHFQS